jgi:uncharacterized protein
VSSSWKKSRYVTAIEVASSDTMLLFAGFAGRLVEVPGAYRQAAFDLLDAPDTAGSARHVTLHKLFREQGVIIPEEFDELEYLRQQHERAKFVPTGSLSLTICPTLNCNFQCSYCYQLHPAGSMEPAIQDQIVRYLERHAPAPEQLFVTWFGGEALLGLPVMERLTERFRALPADYSAALITNGSLLSAEVTKRLLDLKVTWAQITLDGPREVHDSRRPLAGKGPSFDRILGNIAQADPRLAITIRVNVDRRNADAMPELFDQLDSAGLRGRVTVYFASVAPYTKVCADVANHCMTGKTWARVESPLHLLALDRGYGEPGLPRARRNVCLADHASAMVVVPSGLVFKCWNDVTDPSQAIFDLARAERTPEMSENLSRWLNWGPFNFPACEACQHLPLCMGGCPHVGMGKGRGACKELKHNLKETILLYYLGQKRKQVTRRLVEIIERQYPVRNPDPC